MRTLRGRIVSVTRPAYVSAGPHSSEILDDDETETTAGIDGSAQGLSPLPLGAGLSIRAGVRVRPRARSAQNNPAGTSPADRKGG